MANGVAPGRRTLDRALAVDDLRLDARQARRLRGVLSDVRARPESARCGLLQGREPLLALDGACNVLTVLQLDGGAAIDAIAAAVDPLALTDSESGTVRQHRRRWLVPVVVVLAEAAQLADCAWLEIGLLGLASGRILGSAVSWYRAGTPTRGDILCDTAAGLPARIEALAGRTTEHEAREIADAGIAALAASVDAVESGLRRIDVLRSLAPPARVHAIQALALDHRT